MNDAIVIDLLAMQFVTPMKNILVAVDYKSKLGKLLNNAIPLAEKLILKYGLFMSLLPNLIMLSQGNNHGHART